MLVSSHLMSEMQLVADRVVVIGRGRLVADVTIEEMLRGVGGAKVRVRTPSPDLLAGALAERGTVVRIAADELEVEGVSAVEVGDRAQALGIAVHHLSSGEQSLEDAYLRLTEDDVEYHGTTTGATT